jgi:predicted nicotinamide N-methyase
MYATVAGASRGSPHNVFGTLVDMNDPQRVLRTSAGDFPLHEYRLRAAEREWTLLHVAATLTREDESHFLRELADRLPYGLALWPAAVALAHEVASRGDDFRGARVLELGAGTGLPGIVAASFGGRVVQTDRTEVVLSVCRRNGERNGVETVEYRVADWSDWDDVGRYAWILGSDVLYGEEAHAHLRSIFDTNLAPRGRVLLSDPFRGESLCLMEEMERDGWKVSCTKWTVGEEATPRAVAVFELAPPDDSKAPR